MIEHFLVTFPVILVIRSKYRCKIPTVIVCGVEGV